MKKPTKSDTIKKEAISEYCNDWNIELPEWDIITEWNIELPEWNIEIWDIKTTK